jgi:hypothetical protein
LDCPLDRGGTNAFTGTTTPVNIIIVITVIPDASRV